MKINSRHYILIILSIATIILVILSYIFMYNKTTEQARNYIDTVKKVEDENSRKQSEQDLIKMHDETESDRSKIHSFIIQEDKVVDFIETIEKIGDNSDTKIELSAIAKDDMSIKAKVTATGSWSNIMTALMLIENIPLSVSLNDIRLYSTETSAKGVKTWNLGLDIQVLTTK